MLLMSVATIHAEIASPAAAMPATTPRSKPISATHGASAIVPSFAVQSNASITAHVSARPASEMYVIRWRRRANDSTAASLGADCTCESRAEARRRGRLQQVRDGLGRRVHRLAGIDAETDDRRDAPAEAVKQ